MGWLGATNPEANLFSLEPTPYLPGGVELRFEEHEVAENLPRLLFLIRLT